MKSDKIILVTGASGKVAQKVIPFLLDAGYNVRLIARDALAIQNSNCKIYDYDQLEFALSDCYAVVHLAALNNDMLDHPMEKFTEVNVDLAQRIVAAAKSLGVKKFINISTTNILFDFNKDKYSVTKRQALSMLDNQTDIKMTHILCSKIYDVPRQNTLVSKALNAAPWLISSVSADILCNQIVLSIDDECEGKTICSNRGGNTLLYRFTKRLIDICAGLAIIILLWWLFLILWIIIKTDSSGPGLFNQDRVGKNQQIFTCYKFRTMFEDTKQAATHNISTSSVTKIGYFMRRTKLDELPQAINLIRGNMSLVGPRPCLPSQKLLIDERQSRGVYDILPGITGLAQINNVDMSDPEKLAKLDAEYIAIAALLSDIKIMLATVKGSGSGDKTRG